MLAGAGGRGSRSSASASEQYEVEVAEPSDASVSVCSLPRRRVPVCLKPNDEAGERVYAVEGEAADGALGTCVSTASLDLSSERSKALRTVNPRISTAIDRALPLTYRLTLHPTKSTRQIQCFSWVSVCPAMRDSSGVMAAGSASERWMGVPVMPALTHMRTQRRLSGSQLRPAVTIQAFLRPLLLQQPLL